VSRFEYFDKLERVLPVIDEGDPPPTAAACEEGSLLECAVLANDPGVELVKADDGSVRVFSREVKGEA
jgi:hypothetical protein